MLCRLLLILALAVPAAAAAEEAAWEALAAGGHVAVLRHANAPGPMPDPPGFRLEDCGTQRNLDAEGRTEAETLGAALATRGIAFERILSSAWCRCLETARLLGQGEAEVATALNNVHGALGDEAVQFPAFQQLVAGWRGPGTLLLVSHGSTISGALGTYPGQGELLLFAPDPAAERGVRLVGRIPPS
jgi:phosphohistidine phosphatase SixA